MNENLNNNLEFYINLPVHKVRLEDLYAKDSHFKNLPSDWCFLVADIKGSTFAVSNNQHNEVNLAATGCIVAVLNSLKKAKKNRVPYFFGGDGATFLIPNSYKEELLEVLQLQKEHVKSQWNLELIVGDLDMKSVYQKGFQVQVARIKLNSYLQIPVVLGSGLKFAEDQIKKTISPEKTNALESKAPDLNGMECRWQKISPPSSKKSIVCLLVYCQDEPNQRKTYQDVFSELTRVFGDLSCRQPISIPKLKLDATFDKIKREMLATIGRYSYRFIIQKLLETYFGKLYFRYSKDGRRYLKSIEALSETVMIDGLINTIITGNADQMKVFVAYLDQLEADSKIIYGVHITHSSIMSCYVEDRQSEHAHFIDGTEGGYTKAAEMLKTKFH